MTILEDVVAGVEYRNHVLTVEKWGAAMVFRDPGMSEQQLVITFVDENADDPRLPAKTYEWRAPAPWFDDAKSCLRWVFEMILQNEAHEIAEFFKHDGERPFCPHGMNVPGLKVVWPK